MIDPQLIADRVDHHASQPEVEEEITGSPMAWVKLTHTDGSISREGPYPRWMAELILGGLGFDSDGLSQAEIEPEPEWIEPLLSGK